MIPLKRKPQTVPITFERCPVHKQMVGYDGERRRLGLCWGCIQEAAAAKAQIERRN